ncbi:HAMP domain-containing histidine kinase [Leucobacter sp. CSA2]|uniref:histidine kinase n=1 Tax=Leucobacter edaphi TaxID=2796472 RepID=A0A934Q9N3_9MICO|nr:HAMP domain-containing sensor histidine kinase [Leucobacter edaphi]MBK0420476.1 HAMP domain-containing histidine kinase [Leucobacter edaphi]
MSRFSDSWADVSLRTKITGVTVFILFLGLVVAGVGTLSVLRPMLVGNLDGELRQLRSDPTPALAAGAGSGGLSRNDVLYAGPQYYVAMLDAEGNLRYDNTQGRETLAKPKVPKLGLDDNSVRDQVFSLRGSDGVEWRAVMTTILIDGQPSGSLLISSSTSAVNQVVARYVIIFTGFGIAVILLGAALTRLLVTATFLPLAEVEKTALEIARGDYSKRIIVRSPHTEVGHLGESLNIMLDRLDGSLEDRARTIERMRRFIGDASHELRTPLVSVRGYAELYRMGALREDEQVGQAMERIEKEAIRMTSLVEDLLALARLDERRALELTAVPLNTLAQDAALDATAQAPDRTITVIEDPAAPAVLGDGHKVKQLMTNLLGNAMRHTPEGSPIEIVITGHPEGVPRDAGRAANAEVHASETTDVANANPAPDQANAPADGAERSAEQSAAADAAATPDAPATPAQGVDSYDFAAPESTPARPEENTFTRPMPAVRLAPGTPFARFEIVDHGEGIPPQLREKIFGRFWRADTSRNRETGGSGLGLAIVQSIVDAHGGTVKVIETPGGGATFQVDLPAAPRK